MHLHWLPQSSYPSRQPCKTAVLKCQQIQFIPEFLSSQLLIYCLKWSKSDHRVRSKICCRGHRRSHRNRWLAYDLVTCASCLSYLNYWWKHLILHRCRHVCSNYSNDYRLTFDQLSRYQPYQVMDSTHPEGPSSSMWAQMPLSMAR